VAVEQLRPEDAEDRQRRAAGALVARGLEPGDRVGFCVGSSANLLCAVLGALRRGIVPVLLNATLLPAERDELLDDADPALCVLDDAALAALCDGPPVELAPVPLARPMHYTSGTTGRAKGVWSGVLEETEARTLFDDEANLWGFEAADTHLVCSPMYHSVSVRFAAGTLLRGGGLLILDHFDPALAARALIAQRPTTTFMAPTVLGRLLRHRATPRVLGSLRLLVHAGSPCPPTLKRAAMARVGAEVLWEFYGSTEGQFTVCAPGDWLARPGTVGRARPGRRLVTDDDGTVWCHAPSFARFSYWRDPESTARAWRGDAFTVGDIGRLDDEGFLFLDGRRDDLVITGGVNVYPAEVETVLARCPGVVEVAVFGVDDEDWGQRLCAAVVGGADDATLRAHADAHLAPYKRPKRYVRLDELPRTATGKLLRRALPELLGVGARRVAGAPAGEDEECAWGRGRGGS
jgi:acyl-CoA synthetase (AMP-forming)/AMP-acid ligase II